MEYEFKSMLDTLKQYAPEHIWQRYVRDNFDLLDHNTLLNIFSYLNIRDLLNCAKVCSRFNNLLTKFKVFRQKKPFNIKMIKFRFSDKSKNLTWKKLSILIEYARSRDELYNTVKLQGHEITYRFCDTLWYYQVGEEILLFINRVHRPFKGYLSFDILYNSSFDWMEHIFHDGSMLITIMKNSQYFYYDSYGNSKNVRIVENHVNCDIILEIYQDSYLKYIEKVYLMTDENRDGIFRKIMSFSFYRKLLFLEIVD